MENPLPEICLIPMDLQTEYFGRQFEVEITDGLFPSVIRSVSTDGNYPSVVTDRITDGKFRIKKKGRVADVEVLAGRFFSDWLKTTGPCSEVIGSPLKIPTKSPTDLKWLIRTVTCLFYLLNYRRIHRRQYPSVKPLVKVSIFLCCRHSPPLFPFLLPHPNSPHLQTANTSNKNLPHLSTTSYISWSFVVTTFVFWFSDGFFQFL